MVQNISSFYNKFFIFCRMLPSDPPNFIKLLYNASLHEPELYSAAVESPDLRGN
jgi:hypothetical protein